MFRSLPKLSLSRLEHTLICIGTAAYFLGFLAAIEVALRKLSY